MPMPNLDKLSPTRPITNHQNKDIEGALGRQPTKNRLRRFLQ